MLQDTNKKQKCKRKWKLSCSNCFFIRINQSI